MTLDNFRTLIRAYVPSAKTTVVKTTLLDLLINKGVEEVNVIAAAYRNNEKFDVTAETQTYEFSTEIPDFVCMDKSGLWWNDGSAASPEWKKLTPMTRRSLDNEFPIWKDDDSDDPLRYIIESDNLLIHPKGDTALTDGFWAFYIKKPTDMTSGGHYPFTGSTTEITSLTVLDDAIIDYVRWKLARPLAKDKAKVGLLTEKDFRTTLAERIQLLERRLDISNNPNARMRGPTVGC